MFRTLYTEHLRYMYAKGTEQVRNTPSLSTNCRVLVWSSSGSHVYLFFGYPF